MTDGERSGRRRLIRLLPFSLVAVVVVVGAVQLLPFGHVGNPPTTAEPPWNAPETRTLAVAACYDCHSNQTRNEWYLHVAPISWWTANHVKDGRATLNFSEYDSTDHRSGQRVAEVVSHGSMPPNYYTWLGRHPAANLSPAQRQALAAGLQATYGAGSGNRGGGGDGGGRSDDG